MNANTRLRLWKETRALLPMWAVSALWMIAAYVIFDVQHSPFSYGFPAFVFGCVATSAVCFGHEFNSRTMGSLLAQPISRRRIFGEKLSALAASLVVLTALFVVLQTWRSFFFPSLLQLTNQISREEHADFLDALARLVARNNLSPLQWLHVLMHFLGSAIGIDDLGSFGWGEFVPLEASLTILGAFALPPLLAFCTGPVWTLVARNALGGAALTFVCPMFLMVLGVILITGFEGIRGEGEERWLLTYALVVGTVYSAFVYRSGWRMFEELEDLGLVAKEVELPAMLAQRFGWVGSLLKPQPAGVLANLVRKELRLQRPAFIVAAFLTALWVVFIGVWHARPAVGGEIMLLPAIFLGLGIPVTVGIVSTAEERSLGVHEWHLTLPVSARRQWCVKVIIALGVNAVLGLLLPGLLAHASSWLANNPQLVAEIPGRNVSPFLIANGVIICAGFYASSASANPMRALIGTIVLFVCGGLSLSLANSAAPWFAYAIDHSLDHSPSPLRESWWPAPEYLNEIHVMIISWVLLGALLSPAAMGLMNFRRTLGSLRRPMLQMGVLLAIIGGLMAYSSTWGILGSNYERAYYERDTRPWRDAQRQSKQHASPSEHVDPSSPTPPWPRKIGLPRPRD